MAERVDYEIRGTFQNDGRNDSSRSYRRNSIPRKVSTDTNYYDLGRLESPLELRLSTLKEDDTSRSNQLSVRESEKLNKEYNDNSAKFRISSSNSEPHIFRSSVEAERKRCEIHDGFVDSLSRPYEHEGSRDKEREHANVTLGKEYEECSNKGTIEKMQTSFGKLRRIGSLGGDAWKTRKTCRLIHAHSRYTKDTDNTDESSSIQSQASMCQVRSYEEKNRGTSRCNDQLILVDAFEDNSRIASLIDYKVHDIDPEEQIYYIRIVAKFGFDHIIIIGEIECGILFLDCYGRVFLWDDEGRMLWPLGDSPEEASKRSIIGEDQLRWFVVNGIVYEYITKWEDFY